MTTDRTIATAARVVVKVGSSSLTTPDGGLDSGRLWALVDVLAARHAAGTEVVLVSSGAIAASLATLGLTRRPRDLATQQAAAAVGQTLLVQRYADAFGAHAITVGQVLLTVDDVVRRAHYRNARTTFDRLLQLRVLPVVNENDTVAHDEIRFGDNDRLAALVAHLVGAQALLLLSDVDGLYDDDPRSAGARRLEVVRGPEDLVDVDATRPGVAGVGSGGMASKVDAASMATSAGVEVVLAAAEQAGPALAGESVGTLFLPTAGRTRSRLLWLAHAAVGSGQLVLDAGAVQAVVERRSSLLPAGVLSVRGAFLAGDVVDLVTEAGAVVGRGLISYDASELPALLGRSTHELAASLGAGYERELVHRDDLVVMTAR